MKGFMKSAAEVPAVGRRGLVAGLAGVVAGYLAKASERVTQAANGDAVTSGGTFTATSPTQFTNTAGGYGLRGYSGTDGAGSGAGVHGKTSNGYGVLGEATTSGAGLYGTSNTLFGVAGYSFGVGGSAVGVYGTANTGEAIACISQSGIGLHAKSITGQAGVFDGDVLINGNLAVSGMKSAAVPCADGQLRRVYCLEAPESYFEDIGRAKLTNGKAHVNLEKDFSEIVRTGDYDVILTPYGDCKGLFVSGPRSPRGFDIQEVQGGTSSIEFGYRVIAKRKDIEGSRLKGITFPDSNVDRRLPTPPGVPAVPAWNQRRPNR